MALISDKKFAINSSTNGNGCQNNNQVRFLNIFRFMFTKLPIFICSSISFRNHRYWVPISSSNHPKNIQMILVAMKISQINLNQNIRFWFPIQSCLMIMWNPKSCVQMVATCWTNLDPQQPTKRQIKMEMNWEHQNTHCIRVIKLTWNGKRFVIFLQNVSYKLISSY